MAQSVYVPTIGLEIHAELNTKTKMFCDSKNDAAEKRPNINVCPVCMAHPGTLPVINRAAVEHVLRVGTALGANLADYTEFDRKNYFYPDLPKGYQISQYEYPLISGGSLAGVQITRIHLEEDTASSIHDERSDSTLVDYNRAGVPLMELVTEPVIHSAEQAGNFGRELQLLLRYLGASEADMEKGQMRLEANISVAKINATDRGFEAESEAKHSAIDAHAAGKKIDGVGAVTDTSLRISENQNGVQNNSVEKNDTRGGENTKNFSAARQSGSAALHIAAEKVDISKLGTKVEVKNINSFRAMERAIEFEVKRQIALLEKGEKVVQETRGWDENKQATFSQRVKEGSADYRYFPDPDLPSLKLSELGLNKISIAETLPELPWQRRERYLALGISAQDAELYVRDRLFGEFFEAVGKELGSNQQELKLASNYISNDLVSLTRDTDGRDTKNVDKLPISPINFAKLVKMIASKRVSSRSAKELLSICLDGVSDPEEVAKEHNMLQESASAQIPDTVKKIIMDNPSVVSDYKAGKAAALEYLVGQGMKALRGSADPVVLREDLKKQIG